jgi:CRISPR/Cas system-associated protein Cas10 (large subunit of type III CRISPR-Cas system)
MADIQEAKKELLESCNQFVALFGDEPVKDNPGFMKLTGKIYLRLEEVLKGGSIKDKEEALKAFAHVLKAFEGMHKKMWKGLSKEEAKELLKKSPYLNPEQFDEMEKLQQDLLKLIS